MNTNIKDQERPLDDLKKYGTSLLREGERELRDVAGKVEENVKKSLNQSKESIQHVASAVDKEVRANPWSAITGVAVGCLLLGFIMGRR